MPMPMENHHPSTLLSMDSSSCSVDDLNHHHQTNGGRVPLSRAPPDINVSLLDCSPPLVAWDSDRRDLFHVGLPPQTYQTEDILKIIPKVGKKCAKRVDSLWGAWFFFSFYFKPALNDNSKAKMVRDCNGVSGFEKSDLNLDVFMVQHDMENMYMWVFKGRPENALGKMQLRSYMNGHSKQGEHHPFPFTADKGFVRSHRMQRKHYRGLSNPQCLHGIELISSPNLFCLDQEERKRWMELTGRDLNFSILPEAGDFSSWRSLPNTIFELQKLPPQVKTNSNPHSNKMLNGSGLNLSTHPSNQTDGDGNGVDLSAAANKKRKDLSPSVNNDDCILAVSHCPPPSDQIPKLETHQNELHWLNEFSGVMKNAVGPVTAAKTIYEDEEGYLIVVSLPSVDLQRVKVSWRNTLAHGIIKVSCVSTSRMQFIKRQDRTFKLADSYSEHCPPGEFVREIPLVTRIPEDANIEAYYGGPGSMLEILVPKLRLGTEEHEVRICLRPQLGVNELMLT